MKQWFRTVITALYRRICEDTATNSTRSNVIEDGYEADRRTGTHFSIFPARGGSIVTVRRWDKKSSEWDNTVYVIGETGDLAEEIVGLIRIESYRM